MKKFLAARPFTDPDAAARKIVEIANDVEAVQNGRIYIERVNAPFLAVGGTGGEFRAGIERAIALGWLWCHESGLREVHRRWRRSVCLSRPPATGPVHAIRRM